MQRGRGAFSETLSEYVSFKNTTKGLGRVEAVRVEFQRFRQDFDSLPSMAIEESSGFVGGVRTSVSAFAEGSRLAMQAAGMSHVALRKLGS